MVAGYEHEIIEFSASNSGLASRFQETLIFEAWTPEQCLASLRSKFQKDEDFNIPEYLNHLLLEYFAQLSSLDGFASARDVYEVIYKKMSTEWQAAFDFNPSGSLCDPPPMSEEIIRHAFDAVIAPPSLVFKSCVCCIIAQPCCLQVFCVARASAWTVAAAAGAGEACAVAEHVFAVNCCCDASMWSGEVCVGLLHGNSTASD